MKEIKDVNLDDFELIDETLSGNMIAFDKLMLRHEKLVYKIAYGFGKSKENALDITQNVFVKTWQKLSTYSRRSSFKSWLAKVSYNEGVNWVRRNQHLKTHDSIYELEDISSFENNSEDEILARENKSQLIQSLYSLNTKHRLAVVLRYFENMPIKEIAETIGCSEGVVKSMLFRSLQKMRLILAGNK